MRIAILVHNAVLSDSRVQKEALSLSEAGHDVEIHGISGDGGAAELRLPGSDVRVFLSQRPSNDRSGRLLKLAVRAALRTPAALGVAAVASGLLTLVAFTISLSFNSLGMTGIFLGIFLLIALPLIVAPRRTKQLIFSGFAQSEEALSRIAAQMRRVKDYDLAGSLRAMLVQRIHSNAFAARIILRRYRTLSDSLATSLANRAPPDVIHIHDHIALLAAPAVKRSFACPIVWDAHEIYESLGVSQAGRSEANARIIKDTQDYVDYFITINESIAEFYRSHYPRLEDPVVVMNATRPAAEPRYDGRLHAAAGLPAGQKILLFQGGFGPARGLRQLVESAALLRPNWSLVLMGWGSMEDELRGLAAETAPHGVGSRVAFLPGVPQNELQQWTAGASLGAIPYENTGLNHLYCTPNKLWEYPSAGVPILCTSLVEMERLVTAHGIGFLLPREFSAEDIAITVNSLADETLAEAALNCRRFVETDNWDIYGARLVGLYRHIEDDMRSGRWGGPRSTDRQAPITEAAAMPGVASN